MHPYTPHRVEAIASPSYIRQQSLARLPEELLIEICEQLSLADPNEAARCCQLHGNESFMTNTGTLRRLCQTSRQFYRCAQPFLVACAAPLLVRADALSFHDEYPYQRSTPASATLLLLRTLLSRPDLIRRLRSVPLNLSGTPQDCVDHKALTVSYLKRVFGKQPVKTVLRNSQWTRREYFRFQIQRFPEHLIHSMLRSSCEWPLSDSFTKSELDLLITHAYNIVSELEANRSMTSRLLRSVFEDDRTGVNLLFIAILSKPQELSIICGEYGARIAGALLRPQLYTSSFSVLSAPFNSLRHLSVTHTTPRNFGACIESHFLDLPNLQSISVTLTRDFTDMDIAALEDLEGQSCIPQVTIRGDPQAYYLDTLLRCFNRLTHFTIEHQPKQRFSDSQHHPSNEEDTGNIVLKTLKRHQNCLQSVRFRCAKWCESCNVTADWSPFEKLTSVDIDARMLDLPTPFLRPESRTDLIELSRRLPTSLESLAIAWVPFFSRCDVQNATMKKMAAFVKALRGKDVDKDRRCPPRLPFFRSLALERIYYDWYGTLEHERTLSHVAMTRWKERWAKECPQMRELEDICADAGVGFSCVGYAPIDPGHGMLKAF